MGSQILPKIPKGLLSCCGSLNKPHEKNEVSKWTDEAEAAVEELNRLFVTGPILQMFDPEKYTVVEADASGYGIGAVLLQLAEDGILYPCAYMSKKMRPE